MALFVYPASQVTLSGGATEAKQDLIIAELQDIDANTAASATEVTLAALNAKVTTVDTTDKSTATNQATGNASLSSIDTKLNSQATETTLASLNAKVTTVDTGAVTIGTALPAGSNNIGDVDVVSSALPTGAATSANQTTANASLSAMEADLDALNSRLAGALVPAFYDNIELTYVAAGNGAGEIETVVYKSGVSTVATLTLTYDGSDRLATVTKS